MARVVVSLGQDERDALVKLAGFELRNPRDQARHILRMELQGRGLLPTDADYCIHRGSREGQSDQLQGAGNERV
jgi:hypothetical protein